MKRTKKKEKCRSKAKTKMYQYISFTLITKVAFDYKAHP